MASVIKQQSVGSGNSLDYADILLGPAGYSLDLRADPKMRTATSVNAVICLSADYADALAVGAGFHSLDQTKGYNRFFIGLSAGAVGGDYNVPDYANGNTRLIPTSKRIIGFAACNSINAYTIAARTSGLEVAAGSLEYNIGPDFFADNAAGAEIVLSGGVYDSSHGCVFAQNPSVTSALYLTTIAIAAEASGQVLKFYTKQSPARETDPTAITNSSKLRNHCDDFLVGSATYNQKADITVTGMTAAEYLQSHPYLMIHWPFGRIRLRLNHVKVTIG